MNSVPKLFSNASGQSEHLKELSDSVAGFVAGSGGVARVRQLRAKDCEYESGVWKQIAQLGWLGILVPTRYQGLGLGLTEMAVVAEGLARVLAPEPLNAVAVLAAELLVSAENEHIKEKLLPRLVQGEVVAVMAWQEVAGNLDFDAIDTLAVPFADGYKLTGRKKYIAGAAHADAFLVSANLKDGFGVFWVPKETCGATLQTERIADGRSFGTLTLQDTQLTEEYCIVRGLPANEALARAIDYSTAITGAELFGVMSRALEMTLDYLRTRVQFGKPIGSFQALQHRAVDLYIQIRLSCAVLEEALTALTLNPDTRTRAALVSRIKARCSEAGLRITREAIQMHGAMGFTDEHDIGLYLKRALVLAAYLGNVGYHRRRHMKMTGKGEA